MGSAPDVLALFPLSLVLFPGVVLPLHVFEPRYLALLDDLGELPEDERTFGVVCLRPGSPVGEAASPAGDPSAPRLPLVHEVGCRVRLVQVRPSGGPGRFDIAVVGVDRFRVVRLVEPGASYPPEGPGRRATPYLRAEVTPADAPPPPGEARRIEALAARLRDVFARYRAELEVLGRRIADPRPADLADPELLCSIVGSTALLELEVRQELLAAPTLLERLRHSLRVIGTELVLLGATSSVPVPELARAVVSPN
ncbi:MAG: peptidase [Mycobacterium sp.]|nr:peptidase [Mycobacterium sp.]MCW2745053.1 peptidase [Mycobacterium sp.]